MSDEERKPGGIPRGESTREDLTFRYSRERRLENAPESVRYLASRYGAKSPGFLSSIFATRASRLLFFTIIAFILAFNFVPLLSGHRSSGKLGEDRYSAKAFWFEGRVLVSLSRDGRALPEAERDMLELTAAIEGGASASARFIVGLAASENFRLALDSADEKPERIALRLSAGSESLDLIASVE